MQKQLLTIVLAALIGGIASDATAQQRPAVRTQTSPARAEWRTPIPRTVIYGELNGAQLIAVEMLNHNVGWALGHGSPHTVLFRTADGGKSWERLTTFDGQISHLNDIGFADANNGWIVGSAHILRTTDGGESWSPVDTEKVTGTGYYVSAKELLVLGPDAIVVGTDGQNRQIMRTLDGGITWEAIGLVKDGGGGAASENTVTGLALAQGTRIFATTGGHAYTKGRIYRSDDGGHSWENVAEAQGPLHGIAVRGQRGVAVGENVAFFTENGGDTWQRVVIPGRRYAVDFLDGNSVIAVGRDPGVVISRNGGKTWQAATSPALESGAFIAVDAVDPGWWFVASTHALHHFIDPNHTEPIVSGRFPIPVDLRIPGGRALPRGVYDVMLGHRGDEHVLRLDRKGDVTTSRPGSSSGEQESSAELDAAVARQRSQTPPACAAPCAATFPADVTYEKEDVAGEADIGSFFRISLEPTGSGFAVVVRTALTPPRNVALALAAVGAPQSSEQEVRQTARSAGTRAGGLLGRIQKAATGDVRGAVAGSGLDARATQARLRAAKAAPPAVYKVTLRHSLDLFGENKE
ncbi:MAG: YCF48-related protein [Gemmatimonadaceae bacterium]